MKRCIKQVKLVGSQFYSGSFQLRVTGDRHESRRKDEVLPRQLLGSKQINEWSLWYYESDSVYSRQVSMNGYISYIVLAEYQLTKLKIWFINHLVLMKPMRQWNNLYCNGCVIIQLLACFLLTRITRFFNVLDANLHMWLFRHGVHDYDSLGNLWVCMIPWDIWSGGTYFSRIQKGCLITYREMPKQKKTCATGLHMHQPEQHYNAWIRMKSHRLLA